MLMGLLATALFPGTSACKDARALAKMAPDKGPPDLDVTAGWQQAFAEGFGGGREDSARLDGSSLPELDCRSLFG